jgi:ribose transport system substrate-binding protein
MRRLTTLIGGGRRSVFAVATTVGVLACVSAGAAASVAVPSTTPPKGIVPTIPLKAKPPTGKVAGYVVCNLPTCSVFEPYYKQAAAALGWKAEFFTYTGEDPQAAMELAVEKKVNFISITGSAQAAFATALAQAKAAHIPVVEQSATDPADPSAGLYADFGGSPTYGLYTKVLADWMANKSGTKTNVVFVNINAFPILATGEKQARSYLAKVCSGCAFNTLEVTTTDLGAGSVPAAVVAYLQTHPATTYIECSFGDLETGLPQALQAAGLAGKVKIVVVASTQPVLQGIVDGGVAATNPQPQGYLQWLHFDTFARLAEHMKLRQITAAENLPTYVIDTPAAAKVLLKTGGNWGGPAGYQAAFKKLWHVS